MKRIALLVFGLMVVLALGFYLMPYKLQCAFLQWPLEAGQEIDPEFGDVLLIPGSGCNPGCGTEERINQAAELYAQKRRMVVISEGVCFPFEREGFIKRMTVQWGFDPKDIIWDTLGVSTFKNVSSFELLRANYAWKEGIVCTSPFHQRRCKILMKKLWSGRFKVASMRSEHLEMDHYRPYQLQRRKTLLMEYAKSIHHWVFL